MAQDTAPDNTNLKVEASEALPSAFELFKPSWEGIKLNLLTLILVYLVPTFISGAAVAALLIGGGIGSSASDNSVGLIFAFAASAIIVLAYAALLGPAFVHIQLKSARMEKATYQSAWQTSKKFWWRFLVLSLTVAVVICVGLLLFIVPGIIFIRRYFLSQFALIDQDLGLGDSMRASNELSRGRSMSIFGILGVMIVIQIPSFIPFIGQLITFLLQIAYLCAPAVRYDQLKALRPAKA